MLESDEGVRLGRGFELREVLGRNIKCADGVTRQVQTISHSFRYPNRVLINEIEEDETPGGAWVHTLSLSCQMHGNPIPAQDVLDAFDRVMGAVSWVPEQDGKPIVLPNGSRLITRQ